MMSMTWTQPSFEACLGYGAGAVGGTTASLIGALTEDDCPLFSSAMKSLQVALSSDLYSGALVATIFTILLTPSWISDPRAARPAN